MKKQLALIIAAAMAVPMTFTSCSHDKDSSSADNSGDGNVKNASAQTVRFLNFKP